MNSKLHFQRLWNLRRITSRSVRRRDLDRTIVNCTATFNHVLPKNSGRRRRLRSPRDRFARHFPSAFQSPSTHTCGGDSDKSIFPPCGSPQRRRTERESGKTNGRLPGKQRGFAGTRNISVDKEARGSCEERGTRRDEGARPSPPHSANTSARSDARFERRRSTNRLTTILISVVGKHTGIRAATFESAAAESTDVYRHTSYGFDRLSRVSAIVLATTTVYARRRAHDGLAKRLRIAREITRKSTTPLIAELQHLDVLVYGSNPATWVRNRRLAPRRTCV